ncbi:acyl carrier protein [Streptomyces avermitilis]|uniref:acyl carrier protein n=1 Tax=Streptomyces avermitilis TaxID=33903 RepID=UPI003827E4B2
MASIPQLGALEIAPLARDAWTEVLGHDRFTDQDFFFSVGGNSLAAIRLMRLLGGQLGVRLPVRMLFEQQSVELLAETAAAHLRELAVEDGAEPSQVQEEQAR